ncbi:leucine-rich_repeat domain-containing protein [Hexamita inflata]|uniref:Leucine-rich_repeat domain-containing protein n=1 Tax=Hexamita inflata TaxID=28002 RepID=A0ABP1J9T9_9EUKA
MQQDSKKQEQQHASQQNNIDVITNELPEILSEYDQFMIETYQNQISGGTLKIMNNPELTDLQFVRFFDIKRLELEDCKNIIPKLESKLIKELSIQNSNIQSIKDFYLENLEFLRFNNHFEQRESKTLAKEITTFKQLKELHLIGCVIDIQPLQQMTRLIKIQFGFCKIHNIQAIKHIENLEQLSLSGNENIDQTFFQNMKKLNKLSLPYCQGYLSVLRPLVCLVDLNLEQSERIKDISPLQFLTQLTKLSLKSCSVVNLDALRSLIKLQVLIISNNQIVYLQPIMKLKRLNRLYAGYNKITDGKQIEHHPNYNKYFDLRNQKQPTQKEFAIANMFRSINNPVVYLKEMHKLFSNLKDQNTIFRNKVTQQLQKSQDMFVLFSSQSASLFENIYLQLDCFNQ